MSSSEKIQQLHLLLTQGHEDQVRKLAKDWGMRHSGDPALRNACIEALMRTGESRVALEIAEQATESGGPESFFHLACLLRETGQANKALEMLEKAQEAGYEPPVDVTLQRALALADLREEAKAIDLLESLLQTDPNHLLGLFNLASLHQAAGRSGDAEALFQRILAIDPTFSEALVRLIYGRRMSDTDRSLLRKAEKRARSMLSSPLDREGLQFALAKAHDDLGDYAAAMEKARAGNRLQAARIGGFDPDEFERNVDALMSGVTRDWLRNGIVPEDFRPIFIVGHFRSGSTLVEQVLAGHTTTCSLGEVDYFLRLWFEDPGQFLRWLGSSSLEALEPVANGYRELTGAMGVGHARGIDKRPENLLFMGLIRKLFPGARFIHTRRQFLDNAISVYFQQLNDLSRWATSLTGFAAYDGQCRKLMSHWQEMFGEAIHVVDYEHMVTSPESTVRELLAFLELDWEPACLEFQSRGTFVRTASLAQVREGFHSRSVGRGRNYLAYLTDEERAALTTGD